MTAGKLRHRVVIERPIQTRNEYGESIETWQVFAQRWAEISPLSGRELWNAQQVQPDVTHRVRLRYLAGLTTDMRIKFGERVFHIVSILNTDERRIATEIVCKERL